MEKYDKLVAALRCKSLSQKCDSCGYGYHLSPDSECNDACRVEEIYADAAAAIEALQAQLPKRGEWIPIQIGKWRGHKCSCCGIAREVPCSSSDGIPQWKYCPECGAKMEVQE